MGVLCIPLIKLKKSSFSSTFSKVRGEVGILNFSIIRPFFVVTPTTSSQNQQPLTYFAEQRCFMIVAAAAAQLALSDDKNNAVNKQKSPIKPSKIGRQARPKSKHVEMLNVRYRVYYRLSKAAFTLWDSNFDSLIWTTPIASTRALA